jgi:hypothetical protein
MAVGLIVYVIFRWKKKLPILGVARSDRMVTVKDRFLTGQVKIRVDRKKESDDNDGL